MNNSKLLDLYKTLTVVEKRRFSEYIQSPFFNSNGLVVKLHEYIIRSLDADKEDHLAKEKTYAHLFGKSKFETQTINTLMTFLMSHLENFISLLKIEKNKLLLKEYLLISLDERNLDKHFISNSNDYLRILEEKKIHDSHYYYEGFVLQKEMDNYFMKKAIRKSDKSLQYKSDNLDIFYLSEKLKAYAR